MRTLLLVYNAFAVSFALLMLLWIRTRLIRIEAQMRHFRMSTGQAATNGRGRQPIGEASDESGEDESTDVLPPRTSGAPSARPRIPKWAVTLAAAFVITLIAVAVFFAVNEKAKKDAGQDGTTINQKFVVPNTPGGYQAVTNVQPTAADTRCMQCKPKIDRVEDKPSVVRETDDKSIVVEGICEGTDCTSCVPAIKTLEGAPFCIPSTR